MKSWILPLLIALAGLDARADSSRASVPAVDPLAVTIMRELVRNPNPVTAAARLASGQIVPLSLPSSSIGAFKNAAPGDGLRDAPMPARKQLRRVSSRPSAWAGR